MGIEGFPDYDPDNDERMCPELIPALKWVLRRYEEERDLERKSDVKEGYLTEDDIEWCKKWEEFCKDLLDLTKSLFVDDKEYALWLREFLSARAADGRGSGVRDKLISDTFALDLAKEMAPILEKAPNRAVDLAKLIPAASPEKPTRDFLRLVSRCYIWGFDTECIILCRGAFENALSDKYERQGRKGQMPHEMNKRIWFAEKSGWLDKESARDAEAVWCRGNKAVHSEPSRKVDVRDTVEKTLAVIGRLHHD